jgi:hypothetical protein
MAEGRYTRIKSIFWNDEKAKLWSDDAKLLALYLLTSPHNNILGCHVLPKLYISADLNWDTKRLDEAFNQLFKDGFINYDDSNRLLLIVNYLKHNPIENGNQAKAALKQLAELPKSPLLQDLKRLLKQLNKPFIEPLLKRIPEPVTVTVTVTETVNNTCTPNGCESDSNAPAENPLFDGGAQLEANAEAGKGVKSEYTPEFEAFWEAYPRRKEKQAAYRCWKARLREGTQPRVMIEAARLYAEECCRKGTQEEFIKQAKTFLGPNKTFLEYFESGQKVVNINASSGRVVPYRG